MARDANTKKFSNLLKKRLRKYNADINRTRLGELLESKCPRQHGSYIMRKIDNKTDFQPFSIGRINTALTELGIPKGE